MLQKGSAQVPNGINNHFDEIIKCKDSPQLYYHNCLGTESQVTPLGHPAPPKGFELATNCIQFYAIANLDLLWWNILASPWDCHYSKPLAVKAFIMIATACKKSDSSSNCRSKTMNFWSLPLGKKGWETWDECFRFQGFSCGFQVVNNTNEFFGCWLMTFIIWSSSHLIMQDPVTYEFSG